ncbi:MAG: GNAT family N-acetyltransferase, partial [Bacteroidota bacterium]
MTFHHFRLPHPDWAEARQIRQVVFVEEQACPPEEEWDAFDETAEHVLLRIDGETAGTARWRAVETADGPVAKLERFALLQPFRGRGLSRPLIRAVSERASDAGYPDQKLHAQAHLEALYTSLGFTRTGNLFDEAGIPHVT